MARTALKSACPQCGAPLAFGSGHSLIAVCGYCRSTVARTDVDVTLIGKMPDLVATDTRLELGAMGKLEGAGFLVLGRLQLHQGRASWEEWYLSWDDGSYGWLAEAQGRVIVTRHDDRGLSLGAAEELTPGESLTIAELGTFVVEEVGDARVVSAAGELPFTPQLGASYRFVDATGQHGEYLTLDYGAAAAQPDLFVGRQLSYAQAGLAQFEPRQTGVQARGQALVCPHCGAPLAIKSAGAKSLVCDSCRSVLSVDDAGKLAILGALSTRDTPPLPLGSTGELFGHKLEVIGWTQRGCDVEGDMYTWDEYLLHSSDGYHWLSQSDGHWVFLTPMAAGRVQELSAAQIQIEGRVYRCFQTTRDATYQSVQGEFYWQFDVDERTELVDYVAPPYLASSERSGREVNWTVGRAVEGREVWRSFGQKEPPPPERGIGPCQPNPYDERTTQFSRVALVAGVVLVFVSMALALLLPRAVVLSFDVPITRDSPVVFSEPFEIRGSTHALELQAIPAPPFESYWFGLDLALIRETTGESRGVALEFERAEPEASARLGSVAPGRYSLRVEPKYDASVQPPSSVRIRAIHGVFAGFPLVLALLAIGLPALWVALSRRFFELRRWQQSDDSFSAGSS